MPGPGPMVCWVQLATVTINMLSLNAPIHYVKPLRTFLHLFFYLSHIVFESNGADATGNIPCKNGLKFILNVTSEPTDPPCK